MGSGPVTGHCPSLSLSQVQDTWGTPTMGNSSYTPACPPCEDQTVCLVLFCFWLLLTGVWAGTGHKLLVQAY